MGNFTIDGKNYEQNEIEFLPVPVEQAADQLMLAKWIIRNLGYQMGYDVEFSYTRNRLYRLFPLQFHRAELKGEGYLRHGKEVLQAPRVSQP